MPKFRKKPVVIDAERLTWSNWNKVCELADVGLLEDGKPQGGYSIPGTFDFVLEGGPPDVDHVLALVIPTLEGVMIAHEGDWIIMGVAGEIYPCKPDIFKATYEAI